MAEENKKGKEKIKKGQRKADLLYLALNDLRDVITVNL